MACLRKGGKRHHQFIGDGLRTVALKRQTKWGGPWLSLDDAGSREVAEFMVDEGILLPRRLERSEEIEKIPILLIANSKRKAFCYWMRSSPFLLPNFARETGDQDSAPVCYQSFRIKNMKWGLRKKRFFMKRYLPC